MNLILPKLVTYLILPCMLMLIPAGASAMSINLGDLYKLTSECALIVNFKRRALVGAVDATMTIYPADHGLDHLTDIEVEEGPNELEELEGSGKESSINYSASVGPDGTTQQVKATVGFDLKVEITQTPDGLISVSGMGGNGTLEEGNGTPENPLRGRIGVPVTLPWPVGDTTIYLDIEAYFDCSDENTYLSLESL